LRRRAGRRQNSPEDDSRGGAVPDFTELGAPGSIRAAVWPGSFNTARVIHPWPKLGSGRAAKALAAATAGLRGEARRRARGSAVLGTGKAANGCACLRKAKATLTRVYAGLSGDAGCSPRQIHGSGTLAAVFRLLQWPTGYGT
jgi:hypothetical protein